jgi:hypothetical protein
MMISATTSTGSMAIAKSEATVRTIHRSAILARRNLARCLLSRDGTPRRAS